MTSPTIANPSAPVPDDAVELVAVWMLGIADAGGESEESEETEL